MNACTQLQLASNIFLHFPAVNWCYNSIFAQIPNYCYTSPGHPRDTIGYHRNDLTSLNHTLL